MRYAGLKGNVKSPDVARPQHMGFCFRSDDALNPYRNLPCHEIRSAALFGGFDAFLKSSVAQVSRAFSDNSAALM
jgi:hypothetical protein